MSGYIDIPRGVRKGEELDARRVAAYLRAHFDDLQGELVIEQFPHGHSNLTYLLRMGEREFVLRRPPFGNRVKSAHDMGREFRVLSHLSNVYAPAPKPWLHCDDAEVLGAPFYIMERRHGIILRKSLPAGLQVDPELMGRMGEAFIDNLARLHKIDYHAAGLGDLGKPDGYVTRQVHGWTQRYRDAETEPLEDMNALANWLQAHIPHESRAALVHNDYKFDNLLLNPVDLTDIVAVLDWEMATVGDPLLDLGTTLGYWVQADDPAPLQSFVVGPTNHPGSLTRRQLMERYQRQTGFDVSGMHFHYCFGLFKIAVIVQQIYARFVRGLTTDARFATMNQVVANLGRGGVLASESGTI